MSTQILTRSEIGMRPPKGAYSSINAEGITLHYGGPSPWGPSRLETDDQFEARVNHARCPSVWRAWQDFHQSPGALGTVNGAVDIAYTSGVCPHGVRLEGRGRGVRTAAQGTNAGNARSYAVVYIAGDSDPLTDGAKLAFIDEQERLGKPILWVHRDWHSTACPGSPLQKWKDAGCQPPFASVPYPPHVAPPVVPPLIGISITYTLEDSVKIVTTRYQIPKLTNGTGYWDLDGAPGRPLVSSIDRLVGAPVVNGGDGYPAATTVHGVEPYDYGGHVRLRLWGFEPGAAPMVLVSSVAD